MYNFGNIKNTFNKVLTDSITQKDRVRKNLFKEYLKIERAGELLGELTTLTKSDTDGATSDLLSANKVLNNRKNLIDEIK
jgi:hypothetical protein